MTNKFIEEALEELRNDRNGYLRKGTVFKVVTGEDLSGMCLGDYPEVRVDKEDQEKKLYIVRAIAPRCENYRFGQIVGFPIDWKEHSCYNRYLQGVKIFPLRFDEQPIGVAAGSLEEARHNAESRLRQIFQDLYDRYKQKEVICSFRGVEEVKRKRYVSIEGRDEHDPLYVTRGFSPIGIAISYREIKNMVKDGKLPKIFITNPELIPEEVFTPSFDWEKENPDAKDFRYDGEVLTTKKQKEVAESLVSYEEDCRGHRTSDNSLSFRLDFVEHLEIFPEDISFWVFRKESYDKNWSSKAPPRFIPMTYFPYSWRGGSNFTIGNAQEIKNYFHRLTRGQIKSHLGAIRTLKSSLKSKMNKIEQAPLGLCSFL